MAADTLPPLDKLDPEQAWKPCDKDSLDLKWAGHLYRRAAFGGTPAELRAAVKRGRPGTLDLLLKGEPKAEKLHGFLMGQGEQIARRNNPAELRGWWLYCMLQGGHPLREKLTLFWHNHFATSIGKVGRTVLMFRQNRLLREHALGKFEPFLQAMSKDPAMLVWLDSNSNVKGAPNENYAREVMELFSLGVGNYTEKDIREAARAFTGWHTAGDSFEFNAKFHDDGTKTVLGQTGKLNGDDVVRIILKQPAAARFLVRKLYSFLVSEADDPPAKLLEPLAEGFRKSDYDIADLVRTMLSSRLFFSEHAFRQRVKSPVEYVLGAVRATVDGSPPQQALVRWIDDMGQQLFAPPNVKGWRGGKAWLSTSAVLARHNFAQALAMGSLWRGYRPAGLTAAAVEAELDAIEAEQRAAELARAASEARAKRKKPVIPEEPAPRKEYDPARLAREAKATKPEDVVRVLLDAYLPGGVRPQAREKLVAFVARGSPRGADLDRRAREVAHAILTMPESQLA